MSGILVSLFIGFLFIVIPALALVGVIVPIRTNSRRIRSVCAVTPKGRMMPGCGWNSPDCL